MLTMRSACILLLVLYPVLARPQSVLLAPAGSQNVAQPSSGGASAGTSLNSNVFEQVRYADRFQWSQSPSSPTSIAPGSVTVTINAIRGISGYSAPPGTAPNLPGTYLTHKVYVAGTGTPEVVTLTATTCSGASTGTCTVTFTAANSHAAGYTIGTATAGFQEANVDCMAIYLGTNPVTPCTIKGSPYNQKGSFVFNGTYHMTNVSAGVGDITIDCEGALLEDNVNGAPMILYAPNSNYKPEHATIRDCAFGTTATLGRAANGTQLLIWDKSQNLAVRNNTFNGVSNSGVGTWDTVIQVSGDQGFILDNNDFAALGGATKCDTTWCGPAIYGDTTNSAAIGTISNNQFIFLGGVSTAVEWDSGNGMTLRDNIFQNWVKYPWRYAGGHEAVTDQGGNYYEGSGQNNPDFTNACATASLPATPATCRASFSANTGPQISNSGSISSFTIGTERAGAGVNPHTFCQTGNQLARYAYYIVGNISGPNSTRPLYVGEALVDSVAPSACQVQYLSFGATTYDLLRSGPFVNDGTDAAPWGTGNWAVSTGNACAFTSCTITDNFATLSSYQILNEFASNGYTPNIAYWPVPLYVQGSNSPTFYIGPYQAGYVNSSAVGFGGYDGVFTSELGGIGNQTGMRILHQLAVGDGATGNGATGAMILEPDQAVQPQTLRKGRINMPSLSATNNIYLNITNSLLYQTFDPDSNKTLATAGHQPKLNPAGTDCGMGFDNNESYLMFMCGHPISFYVGHQPDSGVSPVLQMTTTGPKSRLAFTSTLATGTAPFSITSTTPVANLAATPTTYNLGGVQQTNSHIVIGSCVLGTSCAVTLVGSAVFSGATTYTCTTQDDSGIFATKVAQASGSSFTVTGNGTDTIRYSCIGN